MNRVLVIQASFSQVPRVSLKCVYIGVSPPQAGVLAVRFSSPSLCSHRGSFQMGMAFCQNLLGGSMEPLSKEQRPHGV